MISSFHRLWVVYSHGPTKVVVHRGVTLWTRSIPIEHQLVSYFLHCTADGVRTIAISVIVNEVRETAFLSTNLGVDNLGNGFSILVEQLVCGGSVDLEAISVT